MRYGDLPAAPHPKVDLADASFERRRGRRPAQTETDIAVVVAFPRTLNDAEQPAAKSASQ